MEIYAIAYDKDFNLSGVYNFDFSTPSYNAEAGEAHVSIDVSDVTSTGAMYTITKGENMFAVMYDTLEAEWFDMIVDDPSYHEFYIHEILLGNAMYFAYGPDMADGKVVFEEKTGTPLTRYYAAACPMNENGPVRDNGWGKLVIEEYTTSVE